MDHCTWRLVDLIDEMPTHLIGFTFSRILLIAAGNGWLEVAAQRCSAFLSFCTYFSQAMSDTVSVYVLTVHYDGMKFVVKLCPLHASVEEKREVWVVGRQLGSIRLAPFAGSFPS